MPKLTKDAIIKLILEQVKLGKTWTEAFAVICDKTKLAENTFSKYYKIATQKHLEAEKILNDKASERTINEEVEARKKALNNKIRRMAILEKKFNELAEIVPKIVKERTEDGKVIEHSITKTDYLKGIEVMAKLDERISKAEGTDAPIQMNNNLNIDNNLNEVMFEIRNMLNELDSKS